MPTTTTTRVRRALVAGVLVAGASLGAMAPQTNAAPSESDVAAAQARLDSLRADLADATRAYESARRRVAEIQAEMAATEGNVRRVARRILASEQDAVRAAQRLYMGGSATSALQVVLESQSLAEVDARMAYLHSSHEAQTAVFQSLARDRDVLEADLDRLDRARREIVAEQERSAQLRAEIEERVAAQVAEVEALRDALARAEAAAAEAAAAEAAAAEAAARDAEADARDASDVVAAPPPPPPAAPVPEGPWSADWDAIAQCESGGRWDLDSTYDGGLQFHPMTWLGYGGGRYARYAWQATRLQQIAIAEKVLASQGPGAWPNCFVPLS
ncbi:MAG TPA: transglycosylase family protein [Actinomycetota bacterium]|nr:transglycosylase family protein [Actinomycetota bacterium]